MGFPIVFMGMVIALNTCFFELSGEKIFKNDMSPNGKQTGNLYYDSSYENGYNKSTEYYDDENSMESKELKPRLLSQSAFNRISETLGALNTVGSFIVNMTRGGQFMKDNPGTLPTAENQIPLSASQTANLTSNNQADSQTSIINKRIGFSEDNNKSSVFTAEEKKKKKKSKNKNKIKKQDDQTATSNVLSSKFDQSNTTHGSFTSTLKPSPAVISHSSLDFNIEEDLKAKDGENRCRTSTGLPGRCEDLSTCPGLLLNLSSLRESLCFKSLFVPGVCCPLHEVVPSSSTTQKPLRITTHATTKRPSFSPNLVLIPHIKLTTTTVKPLTPIRNISTIDINTITDNFDDVDNCGQQEYTTGRIVGGLEAQNGQWPWMAAIFLHGPKRTEFWCGGTLIGSKYILTAAHCTKDSRQKPFAARQFTVRLGDVDLSRDDEPSLPVTFGVKEVRAHERFSRIGFYNDIAILVLDRPARKSKYIIPICLPKNRQMPPKHLLPGKDAVVVGWGTTYYGGKESASQRHASIPIWRNEDCDQSYFQPINENFICAGLSDGGVDACQGDSGGPLLLKYNSYWTQIGVVSFGNKCGEPRYPGVYTRVSQYVNWIEEHTRD